MDNEYDHTPFEVYRDAFVKHTSSYFRGLQHDYVAYNIKGEGQIRLYYRGEFYCKFFGPTLNSTDTMYPERGFAAIQKFEEIAGIKVLRKIDGIEALLLAT